MATAFFPEGLRHPVRSLQTRWSKHTSHAVEQRAVQQDISEQRPTGEGAQSEDRLERIAAYARSGYFHVEYTAGMFVVPLDIPPE